jgi:hypothetical protein
MNIITFKDKYTIVDENGFELTSFNNKAEAVNYIKEQTNVTEENIIEYPFYEVDDDGQLIGN